MLGNRADMEDALQEAAAEAYRHFDQLRGGEVAFGAWMRRILIRECVRILKSRRRIIPTAAVDQWVRDNVPGPDAEATAIWQAVSRLDDQVRPVVVMRYLLDMTQEQISAELGIPVGTVKSRLARGLARLRRMLGYKGRIAR